MSSPGDWPDWVQPANYVYTQLFHNFAGILGTSISVGQYASLHVMLLNIDGTTPLVANYQFVDSTSGQIVESGTFSANAIANTTNWPSWTLPVVADTFKIIGTAAGVIAVVLGTNQPIRKRLGSDLYPMRTFQGTLASAAPSGTTVRLTGADTPVNLSPPLTDCSNYNGQCMFSWSSTQSITGNLFCEFYDASATLVSKLLFQNFSTTIVRLLSGHPYAFVKWYFVTNATAPTGTTTLTLLVIPATAAL